jgi:hypothetical protein
VPVAEGGTCHLDNLVTVCASHHPTLERVRHEVLRSRRREDRRRRCRHSHRTREARRICERRLASAGAA